MIQQKGRPIPIHLQSVLEKENKETQKTGIHRISQKRQRKLTCEPCCNDLKKDKSTKKNQLKKTKRKRVLKK